MTTEALARRNVFILTTAQALGGASPPIIISLGGLVGQTLAPTPALITLPVSLFTLGLALGTIPAAIIMRQFGRRGGYLLGALIGVISGLISTFGIIEAAFTLFCLGTFVAGFSASYVQSYRFAAADSAPESFRAKAISWVMVGGLLAGIIGPQLVIWTRESLPGAPFAGSFLSQSLLALLAIPVIAMLRAPAPAPATAAPAANGGRPLLQIMATPRFLIAASTGIISYGLMSFVMTAAPLAMTGCGHTVGEAALGIQWHILAMFGPSFVTGHLITRFGKERIAALGLCLIASSAVIALSGLAVWHFWVSLILLGVGWNFGFIGATAMVTDCHTAEERAKVQGVNDFLVFGTVAIASFSSGALLNASGWASINWLVFPAVALALVPLLWWKASREGVPENL
ncbi:MAG: MFS transporter [Rhodomicrobiaceae bacterium]